MSQGRVVEFTRPEYFIRMYSFLFNSLQTIQCGIAPLNPDFSPFVDICSSFSLVFNNIKSDQSIRRQTLTGAPRVKVVPRSHHGREIPASIREFPVKH